MGIANANVAKMVIDDINAAGGLLGRQLELHLEDSATDDSEAEAKATKLVQQDHVDVIFGGIYSSTRQAIKGPAVVDGKTLYIYPEQYEGQECDPLIFCTGPVPAQQVEPLIPWLMQQTGAKTFYLPSADYIWPHVLNKKVREVVDGQRRRDRRGGVLPPRSRRLRRDRREDHASGAEVVFNTIVPPGLTPFLEQLYDSGFTKRGGQHRLHVLRRELPRTWCRPSRWRGCTAASTTTRTSSDPFSKELLGRYDELFPGSAKFTAGSACSGMYRGLKLWEAAVNEAGSLEQDDVISGAGPREDRRGPGRSGRDGARPASRSDEHVHRPGEATAVSRSSRALGSSTRRNACRDRASRAGSRPRWRRPLQSRPSVGQAAAGWRSPASIVFTISASAVSARSFSIWQVPAASWPPPP